MCCFCGEWLTEEISVHLVVLPTTNRDESQTLYCHRNCLVERLASVIPKHPALLEAEVADE